MSTPVLPSKEYLEKLLHFRSPMPFYSMYSSLTGAITTDPQLMWIPIDEHIVHRGDGVFEAMICVEGAIYDLESHLRRMEVSAKAIGLNLPLSKEEIKSIIIDTARATNKKRHMIRVYASRGPGSFTANPYDCTGSQLYVVTDEYKNYSDKFYTEGATVGISQFRSKERPFCNIKSVNYLLNALIKKEAIDRGLNYMVPLDQEGFLTESATENIAIITHDNELCCPRADRTLEGTTLKRLFQLAHTHQKKLGIQDIKQSNLDVDSFKKAREIFLIGTTMGLLPVGEFDGQKINVQDKAAIWPKLLDLIQEDRLTNPSMRTQVL